MMNQTDFARWYQAVELSTDRSSLMARWKGIVAVVKDANSEYVETLIRLVFRSRQTAAEGTKGRIWEAFKNADSGFDIQYNDRELEVLSGASLVALMDKDDDVGALAALAITTTAFAGARKAEVPMDLCTLAENAIDRIASAHRRRPTLVEHGELVLPKFNLQKASSKVRETESWEGIAEAFTSAASSIREALSASAERQMNGHRAVSEFVKIQDEELQMLWWLIGQRSWDYDRTFRTVPVEVQPLVFAKELADSTEFLPGPPCAMALLSRAGLGERKKIGIGAAIDGSHTEWLQTLVGEEDPSPVSCPLHFAITRQLETGPGGTWIPGWSCTTGIGVTHAIPSLTLGVLFYRERLLRMFW